MLRTYQYIKSRDQYRYFCLQQNPFMLFWLLFFTKNTILSANRNGFKKWSIRWIKREIREYYYYFRGNIFKLISFVKYKFRLQNSDSLVELPFYGQTCVLVNKGYKIFNLRRGVAIKVYRNDVDIPTITKELECLKNGSQFDFAPSIRRINIKERWYEEEYISGSKDYSSNPRDSKTLLEKFYKDDSSVKEIFESKHGDLLIRLAQSRMRKLSDFKDLAIKSPSKELSAKDKEIALKLFNKLSKLEVKQWNEEKILQTLRDIKNNEGISMKDIYFVITGREQGLPLIETMVRIEGRENILKKLQERSS